MANQARPTIAGLFQALKNGQIKAIVNSLKLHGIPKSESVMTDYLFLQKIIDKKLRQLAISLIKAGCRINPVSGDSGSTPLALAFNHELHNIASLLLKKGALICISMNSRCNVLHLAVRNRSLKMLNVAISHKIGVNHLDSNGRTALQILLEAGYGIDQKLNNQDVIAKKVEMARILLLHGASVGFKSKNGETALHRVVLLKQKDLTKIVLQKFNDVNSRDRQGKTALQTLLGNNWKSENDIFESVKLFIEKGAKIDVADLRMAAGRKYLNILYCFLCQCNVKPEDNNGNTILHTLLEDSTHLSSDETFKHCVDSIISASSLENIQIALHCEADSYHYDILEKMLSKCENVNVTDGKGDSILHILVRRFSHENRGIIKYLLNNGANVGLKNASGMSPMDLALKIGNENLLSILVPHSENRKPEFEHCERKRVGGVEQYTSPKKARLSNE